LERLPDEIGELSSLEKLYIRSESLSELPDVFSQLDSLKSVELNKMRITDLPASFYQLKNLEELELVFCRSFAVLSDDISKLSELRILSINESVLKKLPEGISALENLEVLTVTPSYISLDVLIEWSKLQNLESIYFKSVINPEALLDSICSARLPKLKSIGLTIRTPFPIKENLNNLIALERISFRNSIPIIEGDLLNLNKLHLFDIRNGFEHFSTIKKIANLETIVFAKSTYSDEDLSHYIKDLAEMPRLKSIHIGNNKLKEFPSQLLTLENLTDLNVINNEITSIPKDCQFKKGFRKITFGGVQKKNIGVDALNELKKRNPHIIIR
ncbi:MAG: Leucine-rich repeat (LRR) protein, partial [Saprospiraceae bacterium]